MSASRGAAFEIDDLMDTVPIKNRVVDGMVCIVFDRKQIVWKAGEVKAMPKKVAEWFVRKSMYLFSPGDENRGIKAQGYYTLVIVGGGKDETDITDDKRHPPELIDRSRMQPYDLKTGQPMRVMYIDPNSVVGVDSLVNRADAQDRVQKDAVDKVSDAIIQHTANEVGKIADALPESLIGEGTQE